MQSSSGLGGGAGFDKSDYDGGGSACVQEIIVEKYKYAYVVTYARTHWVDVGAAHGTVEARTQVEQNPGPGCCD
jgi:hypothetical protein